MNRREIRTSIKYIEEEVEKKKRRAEGTGSHIRDEFDRMLCALYVLLGMRICW